MRQALSESAIADTVAAVFRDELFARSQRRRILQPVIDWIDGLIDRLFAATNDSPPLYWSLVAAFSLILALLLARAGYLAWLHRTERAELRTPAGGRVRGRGVRDPWRVAEELAARGEFTEAAHALYRALLESIARADALRLHPAKTIGDYVRELRARSSARFPRFREFARTYEVVVYGQAACDRERYERLQALAVPLLRTLG
jgi:hypothetical protein